MKSLIISGLSVLAVTTAAIPSFANELVAMKNRSSVIQEITPVNLVQLGYQGYFKNQGIPSGGRFTAEANSGDIDAKTLVKSAIAIGRLSPDTINDQGYLNIVEIQLQGLDKG